VIGGKRPVGAEGGGKENGCRGVATQDKIILIHKLRGGRRMGTPSVVKRRGVFIVKTGESEKDHKSMWQGKQEKRGLSGKPRSSSEGRGQCREG